MDFWTWAIPLATAVGGFMLSEQQHRETRSALFDANETIKQLRDQIDDLESTLRYEHEQKEMLERIARDQQL